MRKIIIALLAGIIIFGCAKQRQPATPVTLPATSTSTSTPAVIPPTDTPTAILPTDTPTTTNTPLETSSSTPTRTPTKQATPTKTPTPTFTFTFTHMASPGPTDEPTETFTQTYTCTFTPTITLTIQTTATNSPTLTPVATIHLIIDDFDDGDLITNLGSHWMEGDESSPPFFSPTPTLTPINTPIGTPTDTPTVYMTGGGSGSFSVATPPITCTGCSPPNTLYMDAYATCIDTTINPPPMCSSYGYYYVYTTFTPVDVSAATKLRIVFDHIDPFMGEEIPGVQIRIYDVTGASEYLGGFSPWFGHVTGEFDLTGCSSAFLSNIAAIEIRAR